MIEKKKLIEESMAVAKEQAEEQETHRHAVQCEQLDRWLNAAALPPTLIHHYCTL